MFTTITENRKGAHNGHENRGISELRTELEEFDKKNHPLYTINKDFKDDLIKFIDQ